MTRSPLIGAIARWALFLAYLLLTYVLSSQSHVPGAEAVPDYLLHFPEYSLLTLLLVRAGSGRILAPHSTRVLVASLLFGILYGIFDEIHQAFVPGRDSSVKDALVDAFATLVTVGALALISRRARRGASAFQKVELVTRQSCHLCEVAERTLVEVLGREGTAWSRIDVDLDPDLAALYGSEVPVLLIDGIKRFKGRVDRDRLERLLERSARLRRKPSRVSNPGT